jgi:hypothetical protein
MVIGEKAILHHLSLNAIILKFAKIIQNQLIIALQDILDHYVKAVRLPA